MSWLIGAGLSVAGSVLSNLGVNLQKLTHVRNSEHSHHEQDSESSPASTQDNGADAPDEITVVSDVPNLPSRRFSVSFNLQYFVDKLVRKTQQQTQKYKHYFEDPESELSPRTTDSSAPAEFDTLELGAAPHSREASVSANSVSGSTHRLASWTSSASEDSKRGFDGFQGAADRTAGTVSTHGANGVHSTDSSPPAAAARSCTQTIPENKEPEWATSSAPATSSSPQQPAARTPKAARAATEEEVPFYRRTLWLGGFACVVIGAIADFMALGFASQIVVSPLGATTLVSNMWFAPCFSGEQLTRADVRATILIVLGCGLSVAFASHEEQDVDYDRLLGYFFDSRFFLYGIFIFALITGIWKTIHSMEASIYQYVVRLHVGDPFDEEDPEYSLLQRLAQHGWGRDLLLRFTRFGYAAISGMVGAQSVVFAKGVALSIRDGIGIMFTRWLTYPLLGGMLVCIFLQIKWLNLGLAQFDALYVVPVFQAFWISFSVLAGLVVYRESDQMSTRQIGLFGLGVLVTLFGVYSLSQRQAVTSRRSKRIRISTPYGRTSSFARGAVIEPVR